MKVCFAFFVFAFLMALSSCSVKSAAEVGMKDASRPSVPAQRRSAIPTHNYVYERRARNGRYTYGYARQVSARQAADGVGAEPLIMVLYLGEHHGEYQVLASQDRSGASGVLKLSCSGRCAYIKIVTYVADSGCYGGTVTVCQGGDAIVNSEIVPAGDTVAAAIMQDARRGMLRVR